MSNLSEEEFIFMVLEDLKSKINFNHNESRFENSTYKNAIQIILDLYNKEKEKNQELQNYMKEYLIPKSTINLLYMSKEKIREKIKELDKKEKQELKRVKGQDRYFIKQIYHSKRSFGEELLEEE